MPNIRSIFLGQTFISVNWLAKELDGTKSNIIEIPIQTPSQTPHSSRILVLSFCTESQLSASSEFFQTITKYFRKNTS